MHIGDALTERAKHSLQYSAATAGNVRSKGRYQARL